MLANKRETRSAADNPPCWWRVDDLHAAFERERSWTAHALDVEWDAVRKEFGRLSHGWAPLLTGEPFRDRRLTPLHEESRSILAVTRRIYDELQRASRKTLVAPPQMVAAPLIALGDWLKRVSWQLQCYQEIRTSAAETKDLLQAVVRESAQNTAGLRHLVRRIRRQVRSLREIDHVFLRNDLTLQRGNNANGDAEPEFLNREEQQLRPLDGFVEKTILGGRLTAWVSARAGLSEKQCDVLTAGALLADVGLLSLERKYGGEFASERTIPREVYRLHPALSCGLIGQMEGLAVDVQRVVAEHHEQPDGEGYPHRRSRRQQSQLSGLLAACLGFRDELLIRQLNEGRASTVAMSDAGAPMSARSLVADVPAAAFQARIHETAMELAEQADRGRHSADAVQTVARCVDLMLPQQLKTSIEQQQPLPISTMISQRWRVDAAHVQPAATHLNLVASHIPQAS